MMKINGASETMADDMHDAAMRLGTAAMMLASVSNAVHKRAAQLAPVQTQPDTGEKLGAEGSYGTRPRSFMELMAGAGRCPAVC